MGWGRVECLSVGLFSTIGFVPVTGDCSDLDNTVYPGALEICDGQDNTCDGLVDDNDPAVVGQTTFYLDGDGDGVGSSATQTPCFLLLDT